MMEYFGTVIKQYLCAYTEGQLSQGCTCDETHIDAGLRSLFLHHLLQLRVNSHSVTVVETEEVEEVVQSSQEVQVGSAIFPTASLFNHSCWPNVIFRFTVQLLISFCRWTIAWCFFLLIRFVGSSVVVIATKPIERGEELNNCYGLVW